jgi:hypothetical protein
MRPSPRLLFPPPSSFPSLGHPPTLRPCPLPLPSRTHPPTLQPSPLPLPSPPHCPSQLDEVIIITLRRDALHDFAQARVILDAAVARYPDVVREVPFCQQAFGCAYDEIMTDPNAVYTKIDDDIIFIKDGSFEHLVYQVHAKGCSRAHARRSRQALWPAQWRCWRVGS